MSDTKDILNNLYQELRKHPKVKDYFWFKGKTKENIEYKEAKPPYVVVGWNMIEICYFWIENCEIRIRSAQMYYDDPNIESKIDLQDPSISIVDNLVHLIEYYDENAVQEIRLNDDCKQEYLNCEIGLESKPIDFTVLRKQ